MEEAADVAAADARLLSDLSAAYLARAAVSNQPQDFTKAVTMADRAVKLDPRLAEAWFNRACGLERLSLSDEAKRAWQDYLKVDATSEWASEARARLNALGATSQIAPPDQQRRAIVLASNVSASRSDLRAVIKASPGTAQKWLEEQLLTEWPRLLEEGRADDAGALAMRMQRVADALAVERDDAFWRDAAAAVGRAVTEGRTEALASAHRVYKSAADAYDADRVGDSSDADSTGDRPSRSSRKPVHPGRSPLQGNRCLLR